MRGRLDGRVCLHCRSSRTRRRRRSAASVHLEPLPANLRLPLTATELATAGLRGRPRVGLGWVERWRARISGRHGRFRGRGAPAGSKMRLLRACGERERDGRQRRQQELEAIRAGELPGLEPIGRVRLDHPAKLKLRDGGDRHPSGLKTSDGRAVAVSCAGFEDGGVSGAKLVRAPAAVER
eukprot:862046-Prymnesium_polylepis.1